MRKKVFLVLILVMALALPSVFAEANPVTGQSGTLYVSMGTSSIGGTSYVVGGGLAKIFNENIPGLDVSVQVSGGPQTNLEMIELGDAELGLITAWSALQAWRGEDWATTEMRKARVAAPLWTSYFYVVTLANSPVESFKDLAGKNIASATAGSSSDLVGKALIEYFGVEPRSLSAVTADAQKDGLKDGTLDALFVVNGHPSPLITDLQTTHDLKFINFTPEEKAAIEKDFPFWSFGTIPGGHYDDLPESADMISLWQLLYVDKDLPDTLVYEMVKLVFDHHDELVTVNAGLKDSAVDMIVTANTPLHPGAYNYYVENNIEIPEALMPISE